MNGWSPTRLFFSSPRTTEFGLFILLVLACLAVLLLRRPDAFTRPWFYGEEGRAFLAHAYTSGWDTVGCRSGGYHHLYPRAVAALGLSSGVPMSQMPWVNLGAVLLMYITVWGYVFFRLPVHGFWRGSAVLSSVLVPIGNEIWTNMTNVQWPMALLIPIILFGTRPQGRVMRVLDALVLFLASFTGPYSLVFLPAIGLGWWRARQAGEGWPRLEQLLIIVAGAVACIIGLFHAGDVARTGSTAGPVILGLLQALFYQTWFSVLSPSVLCMPVWAQVPLLLLAAGGLYALFRVPHPHQRSVNVLLLCAGALVLATWASYRGAPGFLSPYGAGIRNFYLPVVFVAWAACLVLDNQGRWPKVAMALLLGWWLVQTVVFIGPTCYDPSVRAIDQAALDRGETIEVDIHPNGWTMILVPKEREGTGN